MTSDLIVSFERFRQLLRPPARLLGLDVGRRRIGLAISDPAWRVATALETVHRTRLKADLEAIGRIVAEWGCCIAAVNLNYHLTQFTKL